MFSVVKGYVVSLALLGIVGCAVDENASESASSEGISSEGVSEGVASQVPTERLDSERAAAIADAKMATLDPEAITPEFAACGRSGVTLLPPDFVINAAFMGPANQRSGSSTSCSVRGVLQPTDDALYFCWTRGNDGFTWTYNLDLNTGVRGWTRDDLLRPPFGAMVGGARFQCLLP
jgi:hypothetical protein